MKSPGLLLAPFRDPLFRSVWIASLAANLGLQIQAVGAAWAMTTITSSPGMIALVQTAATLPIMLFSIVAGALADNFNRRRLMLVAQGLMLAAASLLAVLSLSDLLAPELLLAFTFLLGSATALHTPSWQASVGDIVERKQLPAAITLNGISSNLARSAGPALGGIIVSFAGVTAAFSANALGALALIATLIGWKEKGSATILPRETLGIALSSGLRYVLMSPSIQKTLLRSSVFGFGAIAALALLPLIVRDRLHGEAALYGLLYGSFGLGAILGAFAGHWLRENLTVEGCTRLAFLGFALSNAIAAVSQSRPLTALAFALGGASWVLGFSLVNITVQQISPRWVTGRTLSYYQAVTFGGMALGSWVWGLIADASGLKLALLLAALALTIGMALGLKGLAMPEQKVFNLDPLGRWHEPELALAIKRRSGPVRVIIEYDIRSEDIESFLSLMAERRRIRRRDGARHWTLLRDLKAPAIWLETYCAPTWLEYIRQSHRVTLADRTVSERLRRLHQGAEPPQTRYLIERAARSRAGELQTNSTT